MSRSSKRPGERVLDALIFLALFGVMTACGVLAAFVMTLCGVSARKALAVLATCALLGAVAGYSAAHPWADWSACWRALDVGGLAWHRGRPRRRVPPGRG